MTADPKRDPRARERKHPIAQMLAIGLVASVIGVAIALAIDWFPPAATDKAQDIDTLYDVLLIASVPIFVLVMTVAIYSVVRFRARPGDMGDGAPIHGNARLEVDLGLVPFIIVSVLAGYAWIVLDDIEAKQPNEMRVDAVGPAVRVELQVPRGGGNLTTKELVLPSRPAGGVPHHDEGRDPLVLGPRLQAQVRRRPGHHDQVPRHTQGDRALRRGLRGALRPRPRDDAPDGAGRLARRSSTRGRRARSPAEGAANASGAGTISTDSESLASAGGGGNAR